MFSKIMQHKWEVLGAVTLLSGIGGYLYFRNSKQQKSKNNKKIKKQQLTIQPTYDTLNTSKCLSDGKQAEKLATIYSEFYFDKDLQTRKVLDYLDAEGISIETIYKYSPMIAVNQFQEFTKEIRHRRRLIRTVNQDQYVRLIIDYEKEIDQLLERSREQIVYECEIDPDEFESMKVIFEATQDLTALVRQAKKQLKRLAFVNKRPISKCILQQIINEQLTFIRIKIYDRLKQKLQQDSQIKQQEILKVIQTLIDDIVYEKYGYEREEIQHAMNTRWNKQLQKQIKELKKARTQLESDIGDINFLSQESQSEQQNSKDNSQGLTRSGANSSFLNDRDQD